MHFRYLSEICGENNGNMKLYLIMLATFEIYLTSKSYSEVLQTMQFITVNQIRSAYSNVEILHAYSTTFGRFLPTHKQSLIAVTFRQSLSQLYSK